MKYYYKNINYFIIIYKFKTGIYKLSRLQI